MQRIYYSCHKNKRFDYFLSDSPLFLYLLERTETLTKDSHISWSPSKPHSHMNTWLWNVIKHLFFVIPVINVSHDTSPSLSRFRVHLTTICQIARQQEEKDQNDHVCVCMCVHQLLLPYSYCFSYLLKTVMS